MRFITSTIAAAALAAAASVSAQEQAPKQQPAQPPAPAQAPASTITGCVVQAKTTTGGSVYVLSKAEGGSATMYVLDDSSSELKWTANVNKKVEVTGPVQEPENAASAPDPKVVRPPHIVVESVKVVAESCA